MKKLFAVLFAMVGLLSAFSAQAAGLTEAADIAAFLGAIDLSQARTVILSVAAGIAVVAALTMAVKRGLRFLGW